MENGIGETGNGIFDFRDNKRRTRADRKGIAWQY
jgi:hypothetical protein